jgi:hypothetical protein
MSLKPEDVQRNMIEMQRLQQFFDDAQQAGADVPALAQAMISLGATALIQSAGPDYARNWLLQATAQTFAVPSTGGKA